MNDDARLFNTDAHTTQTAYISHTHLDFYCDLGFAGQIATAVLLTATRVVGGNDVEVVGRQGLVHVGDQRDYTGGSVDTERAVHSSPT